MGKSSAPSAPDPYATANAQQNMNLATAGANASLSHTNQSTPYGNLTWTQNGTNADGTPKWESQITLDPTQQAALQSQFQQTYGLRNGAGNSLMGQINRNAANGFNTSGITPLTSSAGAAAQGGAVNAGVTGAQGWGIQTGLQGAGDLQGQFNNAQQAAFDQQMQYLAPQQRDQAAQLTDQLRQQGITQESNPAAYQHAMDQLNRNNTFQNQQAFDSSFNNGLASNNQLFNQSLNAGNFANQAQQQGFNQNAWNAGQVNAASLANSNLGTQANLTNAAQQNNMAQFNANLNNQANQYGMQNMFNLSNTPLNQYLALNGGTQVQTPNFQTGQQGNANAANLQGMVQSNYQNQLASYNNQQSGMFQLGAAALPVIFSDIRLKKDIERQATRGDGLGVYKFRYLWDGSETIPHIGVMAQEVENVYPNAVTTHPSGYKMVNYAELR